MNLVKVLFVVTLLAAVAIGAWFIAQWLHYREWRSLDQQQRTTIKQLQKFPPPDWNEHSWEQSVILVYNVWGNTTFTPSYSGISNDEMRRLLKNLRQIIAETNSDNSRNSVERVFALLEPHGRGNFVTGHRDMIRECFAEEEQRIAAERERYSFPAP